MNAATVSQLELLPAEHVTTVYRLARLWGVDRSVTSAHVWWAWRCTCGRDVGAEQRCAYSGEVSAARMAWWHRRDAEPWFAPLPGPPVGRVAA